jgi:hypothetical protein
MAQLKFLLAAMTAVAVCLGVARAADATLYKRPITTDQLRTATAAAIEQDEWDRHLQFLDHAVCEFVAHLPPPGGAQNYNLAVNDDVIGLAIAQAAFIRHATTNALSELSFDAKTRPFLQWLLPHRAALEDYRESVKSADHPPKVLETWAKIWRDDPAGREKYRSLALACGLVFDQPVLIRPPPGQESESKPPVPVDARARYLDYRDAAEHGLLRTRLAEMATWELVWVVNAPVDGTELAWAREHVRLAQSQWAEAYAMVPYNEDRLLGNDSIYKDYSLAEIKKKGGVCGDRAYFASITAKANGIPAMPIFGEGRRGGHVWFGFESAPGRWDFSAGRYPEDRYATGYTCDPQTGEVIKEQSLNLLTDPQHHSPVYRQTSRLIWLAEVFAAQKQPDAAGAALDLAITMASRHLPAWVALLGHLRETAAPRAACARQIAAMRAAFHGYPDVLALADQWEMDLAQPRGGPDAAKTLARQFRNLQTRVDNRTDLLVQSLTQRVAALEKQGSLDAADRAYRDALANQGRELVAFEAIVLGYLDFAARHNRQHEALHFVGTKFEELQREPHHDYLAMNAWSDLASFLADQFDKDHQAVKAKRLRRDAEHLRKAARNFLETGLE